MLILSLFFLSWLTCLSAQEVSQSGLRLEEVRPMVSQPLRTPSAMVASVHELATQAGIAVLQRGGNAVDAAVAVAFALAVVHPEAGNLGGSGYMLLRMADGRVQAVDYAGTAPTASMPGMFKSNREANVGYLSVAVPGTPAGMGIVHARFGKLKWRDCLEPARKLAKEGFPASLRMELILKLQVPVMKAYPESAAVFLRGADRPLKQGERVLQPALAETIRRMQHKGYREFYEGETARRIAADMAANGGVLTYNDLRGYEARLAEPIQFRYRNHVVLTMPPSSSGGVALAVALKVLDRFQLGLGMEGSAAARHLLIEALRRGFDARGAVMREGEEKLALVLRPEHIAAIASTIDPGRASPTAPAASASESPNTTHFSIIDAEGNMVSNTYTLSGFYGSQVIARGTGVLLNNHMSVFSNRPGLASSVGPRKRYPSTMAPTLILRPDNSPWAAIGTPGGATIPSTLVQIITNLIDFRMSLRDAVEFPRIHFSSGMVDAEPAALVFDVAEKLKQMGHKLNPRLRTQGDVSAIAIEEGTHWRVGWADGRRGGNVRGF
jgi:gamma-glutamyltranspeptidase/glutathione hydrolase